MDAPKISAGVQSGTVRENLDTVIACLAKGHSSPALELIEAGLPRQLLSGDPTREISKGARAFQAALVNGKTPSIDVARTLLDAWLKRLRTKERAAFFSVRDDYGKAFGMNTLCKFEDEANSPLSYIIEVAAQNGVLCKHFDAPGLTVKRTLQRKWLKVLPFLMDQGYQLISHNVDDLLTLDDRVSNMAEKRLQMVRMFLDRRTPVQWFRLGRYWESVSESDPELAGLLQAYQAERAIDKTDQVFSGLTPL